MVFLQGMKDLGKLMCIKKRQNHELIHGFKVLFSLHKLVQMPLTFQKSEQRSKHFVCRMSKGNILFVFFLILMKVQRLVNKNNNTWPRPKQKMQVKTPYTSFMLVDKDLQ